MDLHHYTECGLDYVYLRDGFEICESGYGRAVRVINPGKLDRTIALVVVKQQKWLTEQEVHFLRGLLDMAQASFRAVLGRDAPHVARWEKGISRLLPGEDLVIRQIYLEEISQRPRFVDTSRQVAKLKRRITKIVFGIKGKQSWMVAM